MRTIVAGLLTAGLVIGLAVPSFAADKKRKRGSQYQYEYSSRFPSATPRQLENYRASQRGGEYYEQDSNAHPVGSRTWWDLKTREGSLSH